ncbi:hypothetical protein M8C21_014618 [Ambrosia artemisiifolia]|uniref:Uncharacterized protein n=1 Tax=Ambrosia artemisiifolia TaxID=4212 RepID=A0AAD5C303_AMBAR|nr:hypothetical protein M8C21_014618 [Ambrosia artemisiifolia]
MFLMAVGLIRAIGDGLGTPVMFFFTSKVMNSIGSNSSASADVYTDKINKNAVRLCYLAIAKWVACFLVMREQVDSSVVTVEG